MRYLLILVLVLGCTKHSDAQRFELQTVEMSKFIDSLFEQGLEDNLIPGGTIGVLHGKKTVHGKAYGFSNVATQTPADFNRTRFQLGSVGKLFTAIAVMKEVQKGNLQLDGNVNDYLKDFQLKTIDDKAITLHHLLTHTAGLNERVIGYATPQIEDIEVLGEHLQRRFPSSYIQPGKEINYSNYGFGLAGHLVELVSGMPFKEYIQTEILDVLQMSSATYDLPLNNEDQTFARGYEVREQFNLVRIFPKHVSPAGSISATGEDLQKFVQAILNEDERLLSRASFNLLKKEHFSAHPLLTGHGYGIEVQNFNGHKGIGKSGNIPGFLAFVILFPQYEYGMFVAVNTETDNFLEDFILAFKDKFFPSQSDNFKPTIEKTDLSAFSGDFRANRYNRNTIEDMFALISNSTAIYNVKDSVLQLFHNGQWQYYQPVDQLVFQNTREPDQYLVFEKSQGKINKMHRNVVIAGLNIPVTFEKVPRFKTVHFLDKQAGYFPIIIVSYLLFPIGWLFILLIRKRKSEFMKEKGFKVATRLIMIFFSLLVVSNIFVFIQLIQLGNDLIFGVPDSIAILQSLSYLIPVVLILVCYRLFKAWKSKEGMLGLRIYFFLYTLSGIIYTLILHQWHFIGLNF